mmetsp:Transcript_858/g.1609  ORF Transcript_858/g.1609 Transcript_858/m.1609 type:complete len:408 (-) Transcript_858:793-2016(-)
MAEEEDPIYVVKRVVYESRHVGICLQNENGPCPLLAISNVLLLRGSIQIHPDMAFVSTSYLIQLLTEYLFNTHRSASQNPSKIHHQQNNPGDNSYSVEDSREFNEALNLQHTLAEVQSILPNLRKGADVNVKFTHPEAFELTREISCFDAFRIRIVHGWLIDPDFKEMYELLNGLSYNHLLDLFVACNERVMEKCSSGMGTISAEEMKVEMAKLFLESSPTQLTEEGLRMIKRVLIDGELAVFFRNNHFGTMLYRDKHLFLLISDVGYAEQENVVWEKLVDCRGSSELVNSDFIEYSTTTASAAVGGHGSDSVKLESTEDDLVLVRDLARQEQVLEDERMAIMLQEEERKYLQQVRAEVKSKVPPQSALSNTARNAPLPSHAAGSSTRAIDSLVDTKKHDDSSCRIQ